MSEHRWLYDGTAPTTPCMKCGLTRAEAPTSGSLYAPCRGMPDVPTERQSALTALVRQDEEDGFYDPPGAEPLRRHINEQAAEITRLRAALAAREAECQRLLAQRDRLVKRLRDAGLSTPFEAENGDEQRAALRGEEAINDER